MLASAAFASRPLASGPLTPRPFLMQALVGEYGWAAWSFSRQAKLNAWAWHGLGTQNPLAWAALGSHLYMRKDSDDAVHVMAPDTFLAADEASFDSDSVEATTQWLDFGKPGKMKALTGIDADCQNVSSIEVYVAEGGNRAGVLVETIHIGSNQQGWTYSGEMIPLSCAGTEFKLRFIGDPNMEVQVNRLTIHFDEIAG